MGWLLEIPEGRLIAGGREPNVKPSLNERWPAAGDDTEDIKTPPSSDGEVLENELKEPKSTSCVPSSAIEVDGSDPGRGKKMERLRECSLECLRV